MYLQKQKYFRWFIITVTAVTEHIKRLPYARSLIHLRPRYCLQTSYRLQICHGALICWQNQQKCSQLHFIWNCVNQLLKIEISNEGIWRKPAGRSHWFCTCVADRATEGTNSHVDILNVAGVPPMVGPDQSSARILLHRYPTRHSSHSSRGHIKCRKQNLRDKMYLWIKLCYSP